MYVVCRVLYIQCTYSGVFVLGISPLGVFSSKEKSSCLAAAGGEIFNWPVVGRVITGDAQNYM